MYVMSTSGAELARGAAATAIDRIGVEETKLVRWTAA
jgi:hypothetical protein